MVFKFRKSPQASGSKASRLQKQFQFEWKEVAHRMRFLRIANEALIVQHPNEIINVTEMPPGIQCSGTDSQDASLIRIHYFHAL